ncbi:hypothetical protein NDU88_003609 [Pleurodeles waltl]|uniref:Uncharacterized protein n=1 Tax=Pleurodeles waltl TaxID=8319 RepID=A0AAV7SGE9_PLEWA|nr:hypothetical protein NDU88_003609 [Pleurodeles waltl]
MQPSASGCQNFTAALVEQGHSRHRVKGGGGKARRLLGARNSRCLQEGASSEPGRTVKRGRSSASCRRLSCRHLSPQSLRGEL